MTAFRTMGWVIGVLCLISGLCCPNLSAEVTLDGSFGPVGSVAGPDYAITAGLGHQQGANLFHSFETFNINTGESAVFSGPSAIANIIGRVTGGSASTIDGKLASTIDGANLFMLNPSGILFGPNASLDVSGSFHASTCDYLMFGDNSFFYADPDTHSTLTSAPVSAFGFLNDNPAGLSLEGSLLSVDPGQVISLAGGSLSLDNANLLAQGGHISLSAPGGTIEINRTAPQPDYDAQTQIADIEAGGLVSGYAGGDVSIVGGQLVMTGAQVRIDNYSGADGGTINLVIDTDATIQGGEISATALSSGSSGRINIFADTFTLSDKGQIYSHTVGTGNAGDADQVGIFLSAREINFLGGGQISSSTYGAGNAADIMVTAAESVTMSGFDDLYYSGIFANTEGSGNSGNITVTAPAVVVDNEATIHAAALYQGDVGNQNGYAIDLTVDTLALTNGGQVSSRTNGSGNAGTIHIDAGTAVSIDGYSASFYSGIVADSFDLGNGGSIQVTTPLLTMSNGAVISNYMYNSGAPGSIFLDAAVMTMTGGAKIDSSSYAYSDAGDIHIETRDLTLENASWITASSGWTGNSGDISITALDSFSIIGNDDQYVCGLTATSFGDGKGGNISIVAPNVTVAHEGIVQAAGFGTGDAGSIYMDTDVLNIESGGRISASSDGYGSAGNVDIVADTSLTVDGVYGNLACGIFALTGEYGGNGGDISITTPSLYMSADSRIEVSTDGLYPAGDINLFLSDLVLFDGALLVSQSTGAGQAGNINLTADNSILMTGYGFLNRSGIGLNAWSTGDGGKLYLTTSDLILTDYGAIEAATADKGAGGSIVIDTDTLSMSVDSTIFSGSAADTGGGDAGDIEINAAHKVTLHNSSITTRTTDADGGNIVINTSDLLKLFNSTVSTSVAGGVGDGGNITVDPAFVVLDNTSRVIANAYQGSGGNIGITADYYLAWPGALVDASSQLGIQGTVLIDAPSIDLSGVLAVLPESGEIPELNRDSCASRNEKAVSSLVVAGRGGLPAGPAEGR